MNLPMTIQFIANALALIILAYTFFNINSLKSRYFILIAFAIFNYTFGYMMELDAHSLEGAFMALRIQYYGIPFIPLTYYLFLRDYDNRPIQSKWQLMVYFFIPFFMLFFANAYPDTTLFFKQLVYQPEPDRCIIIHAGGLYYMMCLFNLFFFFLCFYELIFCYPHKTKSDRTKQLVMLLSVVIPCMTMLFFGFNSVRDHMVLSSCSLTLSELTLLYYIVRHRTQDWVPYSPVTLLEYINDGFIILDNKNCFIDANAVAKNYFPGLHDLLPGDRLVSIQDFPWSVLQQPDSMQEFVLRNQGKKTVLRASKTHIDYKDKGKICTCIMLYDITELSRLMEELEVRATQDALTKLRNRGAFFALAARDFELHERTNSPATVMMIDIDHFKSVNDQYGHPVGDMVLREFAAILKERLRHTDISGRYGGEEFCVFLPATKMERAYQVANDIRREIEHKMFATENERFHVTASIGLAAMDVQRHSTLEEVIADADAALYEAKETGRNQVVCFHPPLQ